MQFFYIDYMNGDKKERNVGFLRVERSGICVGLRGVPVQCGNRCSVFAIGNEGERWRLGDIELKNGSGMGKLAWEDAKGFEKCICVEVPFYGTRRGLCILRAKPQTVIKKELFSRPAPVFLPETEPRQQARKPEKKKEESNINRDLPERFLSDKWEQLADTYPQVHIFPEAQSLLIKPKDLVVLTQKYHGLISNSFVLHSYYNYRQLLLFRLEEKEKAEGRIKSADVKQTEIKYYLGVPGVYYEREKRIAQMFGFEGFDIGEARMCREEERQAYEGCFGYYMKQVEI